MFQDEMMQDNIPVKVLVLSLKEMILGHLGR